MKPYYIEGELEISRQGVIYNIFFKRSRSFYVTKFLIPILLFTYVSFGLFLLDLRLGERIGFGISILLVNVAQDIITNEYIPISQENMWMVTFIQFSTFWIFAALFQSIFISWFYYKTGEYIHDDSTSSQTKKPLLSMRNNELLPKWNEDEVFKSTYETEEELLESEGLSVKGSDYVDFSDHSFREQGKKYGRTHLLHIINPFFRMTEEQRISWINAIDRFCMFLFPISYSIFVLIMFLTNSRITDNVIWVKGVNI